MFPWMGRSARFAARKRPNWGVYVVTLFVLVAWLVPADAADASHPAASGAEEYDITLHNIKTLAEAAAQLCKKKVYAQSLLFYTEAIEIDLQNAVKNRGYVHRRESTILQVEGAVDTTTVHVSPPSSLTHELYSDRSSVYMVGFQDVLNAYKDAKASVLYKTSSDVAWYKLGLLEEALLYHTRAFASYAHAVALDPENALYTEKRDKMALSNCRSTSRESSSCAAHRVTGVKGRDGGGSATYSEVQISMFHNLLLTEDRWQLFAAWCKENGIRFPRLAVANMSADHIAASTTTNATFAETVDSNYRGVRALMDIPVNELLLIVPKHMIIHEDVVRKSPLNRLVAGTKGLEQYTIDQFPFIIWFWEQKYLGKESFWYPYINILPTSFDSHPVFFNEEETTMMNGTQLGDLVATLRKRAVEFVKDVKAKLPNSVFQHINALDFIWSSSLIMSRTFSIKMPSSSLSSSSSSSATIRNAAGGDGMNSKSAYVPFADLINHKRVKRELNVVAATEWGYRDKVEAFVFEALIPFQAGAEVYTSYGRKPNEILLHAYGFVDEKNDVHPPYMHATLRKSEDPNFGLKMKLINKNEADYPENEFLRVFAIQVDADKELNRRSFYKDFDSLLSLLRLQFSDKAEVSEIRLKKIQSLYTATEESQIASGIEQFRDKHFLDPTLEWNYAWDIEHDLAPVSMRNEKLVIDYLANFCRDELKKFPVDETVEHDALLLQDLARYPPQSNKRNAIIVRLEGKRSLLDILEVMFNAEQFLLHQNFELLHARFPEAAVEVFGRKNGTATGPTIRTTGNEKLLEVEEKEERATDMLHEDARRKNMSRFLGRYLKTLWPIILEARERHEQAGRPQNANSEGPQQRLDTPDVNAESMGDDTGWASVSVSVSVGMGLLLVVFIFTYYCTMQHQVPGRVAVHEKGD